MKSVETKVTSSANGHIQAKRQPFFSKEGQDSFFSKSSDSSETFFNNSAIQPKLTIGQPNDKYELEADAMADKVVQKLSLGNDGVQSIAYQGNVALQAKCDSCEKEEEEVQKKEDNAPELLDKEPEIQEKPIFESNGGDSVMAKAETNSSGEVSTDAPTASDVSTAPTPSIQAKCESCEEEEKQEEDLDGPQLQKKSFTAGEDQSQIKVDEYMAGRSWEEAQADKMIMFKNTPSLQLSSGGSGESSVRQRIEDVARKELGKVEARTDDGSGRRVGADRLLEYFHLAAPGEWSDDVIEQAKYTMEAKQFPHWCGIFSVYAIKKAGIDVGDWKMGVGVSQFNTLEQTKSPQKGDVGYIHEPWRHHCIITEVNGDTVKSIDGNSGTKSEVIERTRPITKYTGFFTAFTGSEKYIQKKEDSPVAESANGELQDKLSSSAGKGNSMDDKTQNEMESGFGLDFSGVNIHTDSKAVQMNKDLNAQAFTHGNDIYFNEGKYNPETSSGQHLLAHELTHTVQQGASSISPSIQKNSSEDEEVDATKLPLSKGQMNAAKTEITFDKIGVPGFKLKKHRADLYNTHKPLKRMRGYSEEIRPDYKLYKKNWLDGIPDKGIKDELIRKLKSDYKTDNDSYVFKAALSKSKSTSDAYYFGKLDEIVGQLKIPVWGGKTNPKYKKLNIDHIVELQLANWNNAKWANKIGNLELLQKDINRNSGNTIKETIIKKIDVFNKATKGQFTDGAKGKNAQRSAIKNKYTLVFNEATQSYIKKSKATISTTDFWTRKNIEDADHLKPIKPAHLNELDKKGEVKIFPKPGVRPKTFKWKPGMEENIPYNEKHWFGKQIVVTYKKFDTESDSDELGHVRVTADKNAFLEKYSLKYNGRDVVIPIKRLEGTRGVGSVAKDSANHHLLEWFKEMSFDPFSPIRIDNIDFGNDGMLVVTGKIVPGLPIIKGAEIDFRMQGGEVQIFKEFIGPEIKLPSPFNLNGTSLRVYADSKKGLGITGVVDFEIEKIAQGHLEADLNENAFSLSGDLNFESKWFEPAKLKASYTKSFGKTEEGSPIEPKWLIAGKLGLKKDIKGVKKLLLEASYDGTIFSASGDIEFDVPGIQGGRIEASYNNETKDFGIAGEFQLNKDIPGIDGGCVAASFTRENSTGDYSLGISGAAQPNIPGLSNTNLCISYKDGVFVIEGEAAFKKGIASGKVKVGVTNQIVDGEGKPKGGESKKLSAYGNGSLTIQFSKFLEGTVGAKVTPAAKILLSGQIKIPDKIPLTKAKDEFNKTIVPFPTISIPIIGISALGKTVGIAAKISGGVDAYASLGPLSLTKLYLKLNEFDPMDPSTAVVEGGAAIDYPAKAGIKVRMNVGVALSILILEAGGELIGSLGLELNGNAGGEIKLRWSAQKGLEFIEAQASAHASAQMVMSLKGRLYADLDLLLKTINLWEQETTLAERKFGAGLKIGIKVPLQVEDGKLKGIKFEDIEFEKPDFSDPAKRDKLLDDALTESEKPPRPDPPGREEAIKILKRLPAKASDGVNIFNFDGERYSYIYKLKTLYPDQDWSFIPKELKTIENSELYSYRMDVFTIKKGILGRSLVETRLMAVRFFEEDHRHVDKELTAILKQEIRDVGNE